MLRSRGTGNPSKNDGGSIGLSRVNEIPLRSRMKPNGQVRGAKNQICFQRREDAEKTPMTQSEIRHLNPREIWHWHC
jgi:hypothetical protein